MSRRDLWPQRDAELIELRRRKFHYPEIAARMKLTEAEVRSRAKKIIGATGSPTRAEKKPNPGLGCRFIMDPSAPRPYREIICGKPVTRNGYGVSLFCDEHEAHSCLKTKTSSNRSTPASTR